MKMRFLTVLLALSVASVVHADAASALVDRLKPYQQFSAEFRQQVVDSYGQELSVTTGQLALDGASRFRWQTAPPFQQLIVADGEVLWIFDEDLLQVQVRSLDSALVASPAAILGGTAAELTTNFFIEAVPFEQGTRFELRPKASDEVTESVVLVFSDAALQALEFADALGQRTVVRLSQVSLRAPDRQLFDFVPPVGADVIYALDRAP